MLSGPESAVTAVAHSGQSAYRAMHINLSNRDNPHLSAVPVQAVNTGDEVLAMFHNLSWID